MNIYIDVSKIKIFQMELLENFMVKKDIEYARIYTTKSIDEREQEIERLDNIINELEKTLLEWHEYWEDDDSYSWQYKNAYDYLQELKGSDKECQ